MTLPTRTLKDYRPQHDPNCAIWTCGWQWHTENGSGVCRLVEQCEIHYRGTPDSHDFVRQSCTCGLDEVLRQMVAEFDAPGAQERTTEKNDSGAGLAAVPNDTGSSTTETARERIIEKGCEAFDVHGEGSYLAAAAEALTILQEQKSTCWCDEESPVDVIPLSALQALTAKLSDGNQASTQSSGHHRGSAAQKASSHSRPSLTEET